jgi:hypothetical protein
LIGRAGDDEELVDLVCWGEQRQGEGDRDRDRERQRERDRERERQRERDRERDRETLSERESGERNKETERETETERKELPFFLKQTFWMTVGGQTREKGRGRGRRKHLNGKVLWIEFVVRLALLPGHEEL